MAIKAKTEKEIALDIVSRNAEKADDFETVLVSKSPTPISVRLTQPLLKALDGLAEQQHRKRGNLIQHILWEYVKSHSAPAAKTRTRAAG
jgi:hypothetical protein